MAKPIKVTKILAPTVPLILQVDDFKLELELAWTMRAVILLESHLRTYGKTVNVLQNPSQFWTELDCTMLTIAVWALAQQTNQMYADDDGFDIISSYLTTDNYGVAAAGVKKAYLESLSEERRNAIETAEAQAAEASKQPDDPTPAPAQS
jgi:hypothetical protein